MAFSDGLWPSGRRIRESFIFRGNQCYVLGSEVAHRGSLLWAPATAGGGAGLFGNSNDTFAGETTGNFSLRRSPSRAPACGTGPHTPFSRFRPRD